MNVSPLNPHVPKASTLPVEQIAKAKNLDEKQKVAELTRQFESVLLRQILTDAHKPMFKSSATSGGATGGVSSEIYKDMLITQLADKISSSRAIGLAQTLEKQVTREPKIVEPKILPDAANTATKPAPVAPIRPNKAQGL